MTTAVTSHLVLLDVASGLPFVDQHFALPRGCKPSRMTNRLHREFRKVINSYTESQQEQLRAMFGEKFRKLMNRNEQGVMLTNKEEVVTKENVLRNDFIIFDPLLMYPGDLDVNITKTLAATHPSGCTAETIY